jgi:hypothetical protein
LSGYELPAISKWQNVGRNNTMSDEKNTQLLIILILLIGCNKKESNIIKIEVLNFKPTYLTNTTSSYSILDYTIIDGNGVGKRLNNMSKEGKLKYVEIEIDKNYFRYNI